jgi:uncharacterized peroxidase-related enzyme
MAFIRMIGADEAEGPLKAIYDGDRAHWGDVSPVTRMWSLRPDALEKYLAFKKTVFFGGTTLGRVREELLATVLSRQTRCSYCAVTHGEFLREALDADHARVLEIARDYRSAGLAPADVAMLDFAVKVTDAADRITADDVEALRRAGFDETQVLDIILVAAYRNFMSRVVNAAGLTLEGRLAELPAAFKDAIATGRPV